MDLISFASRTAFIFYSVIGCQLSVIGYRFLHESPLRLCPRVPSLCVIPGLTRNPGSDSIPSVDSRCCPCVDSRSSPRLIIPGPDQESSMPLCQLSVISYQFSVPSQVSIVPLFLGACPESVIPGLTRNPESDSIPPVDS